MAITITVKVSTKDTATKLSEMTLTKLAFLRSDGMCAFHFERKGLVKMLSNTFENEHVFKGKDSTKMLIACKSCNVQKMSQDLLSFMHYDTQATQRIIDRLSRTFTAEQILQAGKDISRITCENSAENGDDLTTSEILWICHPTNRIDKLPKGTNIYAKASVLNDLRKVYDLSECNWQEKP